MAQVYLSVSSNFKSHQHIGAALMRLREVFGFLQVSSVYRNQALNHRGHDYLNLVLGLVTSLSLESVVAELKEIENQLGREREQSLATIVSIDLDVLRYEPAESMEGSSIYSCPHIPKRSFLLLPLSEVAAAKVDPKSGCSYAVLWERFDQSTHPLQLVELSDNVDLAYSTGL